MDNSLYESIIDSSKALKEISNILSEVTNKLDELNSVCKDMTKNDLTDLFGDIATLMSIGVVYAQLIALINKVAIVFGVASTACTVFTAALVPLMGFTAIIGVIYGIIGMVDKYCSSSDESTKKTTEATVETEKQTKKINEKSDALRKNTDEIKKNTDATIENVNSIEDDYSMTLSQVDELEKLTGPDGYVGNMEKAKYLVEEINKVLPDGVELTEKGKVIWNENTDAIKKNIKELERRAILEAYQEDYAEALKNRTKYEAELTAAENAQANAAETLKDAKKRYLEEVEKGGPRVGEYSKAIIDANENLNKQNEILDEAKSQYAQNEKAINLCTNSYDALDGNIQASAKVLVDKYTEVGKMGTSTWESIGNALLDLDTKQQEHLDNGKTFADEEVQTNAQAMEYLRQQAVEKAQIFGKSYDEMIAALEKKGIVLSENEKELLEAEYNNYKQSSTDKTALQKEGFDQMIAQLEECGVSLTEIEKEQLAQRYMNWDQAEKAKKGIEEVGYTDMLAFLEESGIKLNDLEKSNLDKQIALWIESGGSLKTIQDENLKALRENLKTQLDGMNEDQRTKLTQAIEILAASGIEGGYELCQKLSNSLAENNGKVTTETQGIIDDIISLAGQADPNIKISATEPDVSNVSKNVTKNLNPATLGLKLTPISTGLKILGKFFNLDLQVLASGGFVDTGELFVAREAGPELVGRINGKTAVANNDQIVSGISSGVYNAVVGAMASARGSNTTVTAVFQVDGKQVAKQVIKAHNKEVMQTGRSPLLI